MKALDRVGMLPRNLERAFGYDGKAGCVALCWMPMGDRALYDGDESAMTFRLGRNQDVDSDRKAHFFDRQRGLHGLGLHHLQQCTGHTRSQSQQFINSVGQDQEAIQRWTGGLVGSVDPFDHHGQPVACHHARYQSSS
jgi:hypothetical protein